MKLWSHAAAQRAGLPSPEAAELWLRAMGRKPEDISEEDLVGAIAQCKDEQEALSRRYGAGVVMVLPLESGRLAVFGQDRQLRRVVEAEEILQIVLEVAQAGQAQAQVRRQAQARGIVSRADVKPEDIGL